MNKIEFQYIKPVEGKAKIKNSNGDIIIVDVNKALECYNKFNKIGKTIGFPSTLFGKSGDYIDSSLVDGVGFKYEHIALYTKEGTTDDYTFYMLLIPEKVYVGNVSMYEYYKKIIDNMYEKLNNITELDNLRGKNN